MKFKKVPIEVYERLVKLQGHTEVDEGIVVVPYIKDMKRRLNQLTKR